MLSTFAIVILLMLAAAVSNNYRCGAQSRGKPRTARVLHARLRRAGRAAAALALTPPRCVARSFLGQAWKGDKENPQSNGAATRTILACAAVYACFLGLSSACPRHA